MMDEDRQEERGLFSPEKRGLSRDLITDCQSLKGGHTEDGWGAGGILAVSRSGRDGLEQSSSCNVKCNANPMTLLPQRISPGLYRQTCPAETLSVVERVCQALPRHS